MSVRDAMRPLNGSVARQAPAVVMGWNGKEPRVTIKMHAGACFSDPQLVSQMIEDLQVAYGHLMAGPRE